MFRNATFVALACALLAAAGFAGAAAPGPQAREESDKIVLQNEHVTVWFQGKKPMLKVFATASANATGNATQAGYEYHFKDLVEYRDVDSDGLPGATEVLARLSFEKASAFQVNRSEIEDGVVVNLTLEAPVKVAGGLPVPEGVELPDRAARVSIVFTLRGSAATLPMGDANVTVPPSAVKYDLVVERWPSVDATTSRLALDVQVVGATDEGEVAGLQGLTVSTGNGTKLGAVSWADVAQGVSADGAEIEVPVTTKVVAAAEGEEAGAARVVHTFDAPGLQSLVYDPVLAALTPDGLDPSAVAAGVPGDVQKTVPGAPLALLAAVAALAAVVARRR